MGILEKINGPDDLKKIKLDNFDLLSREIREFLIETAAKTGGHLAPSLGVVELTLALHYVFTSGKDKIIWDVGHQAYVHKILTGRKDAFGSLRQYQGISGFPKREESIHDVFDTGHSSTSISAALGYTLARNLLQEDFDVIAVIGDGALTGGQAFEGLNHAGHQGVDMLVVLNDNEMSIAQNVGAMSSYLSRLRSDPFYTKRKKDVELLLRKIPSIGPNVVKAVERVKDSMKYLLVPGMLFEELGFTYLGPIDGHNIRDLVQVLNKTKEMKGPVLLHVLTKKGKGYPPAEKRPEIFHGVGSFDANTGEVAKSSGPPKYTKVFSDALVELAERDNRIVAVTAAMPDGTGLHAFSEKFPQRFYDVGIAEQNAVTVSAAMALKGLRPVVAIYSTFLQRAYDQVIVDVCLQDAPVVFALDRAGLVGEDGPTHHGSFDLSYLRCIPGMSVMAPKDEEELRHMLFTAFQYNGPVALRYPRGSAVGADITTEYRSLPWGKGEILATGSDLAIAAVGSMVYPALAVKEILEENGLGVSVVNARFVKPLDEQLILEAVKNHQFFVTMEENVLAGGFGSCVLELLAREGQSGAKILNIGLPDKFVTHGSTSILKEETGLTPEKMADKIISHFGLKAGKRKKVILSFRR